MVATFEELIEEAATAPIDGWDYSWLDGRATEERPAWRYSQLVANRSQAVSSMLDLQTGGGELIAGLPDLPPLTVATEGWEPNVGRAGLRLLPHGAWVVATNDEHLPFGGGTFDLVTSRHPVATWWDEVARVLRPGGRYLSQQVGPYSMQEVAEFLMGPRGGPSLRTPELASAGAESAGLRVQQLETTRLRATFSDVGAVVYFLRLVIWIVPNFTVEVYRDQLLALHKQIEDDGPFVAHATRFLIEATKPD